ncbi:MAG TPA: hypothetical protein VGN81_34425 [Pseudonocardiaceae bacterium]
MRTRIALEGGAGLELSGVDGVAVDEPCLIRPIPTSVAAATTTTITGVSHHHSLRRLRGGEGGG